MDFRPTNHAPQPAGCSLYGALPRKLLLLMKLTAILLFVTCMQVSAKGYAQRITLSEKNAPIEKILAAIKQQSGYDFFYNVKTLEKAGKVTVQVRNASLEEALAACFGNTNLTYTLTDHIIVIKEKERTRAVQELPEPPPPPPVKGKVLDEFGNPLPNVSVRNLRSGKGVATDEQGGFVLDAERNDILEFSYVGYETQKLKVSAVDQLLSLSLKPDAEQLGNLVVIGYGTAKKRDLTGAVSQVKAKEINAFPAGNVLQALTGRAAGVQVLQNNGSPGGSISVRIRGTNSIQGSNEPLYVVDGFPVTGSNPSIINNADIESVEILKDASATAIYGSRGANGVVLITTRKGKAGRTRVEVESTYSIQTIRKKLDLMNAREYALFYNEQTVNDNETPYFTDSEIAALGEGTDWQDLVFRSAPIKTLSLNLSGGSDKTQYALSGSIFDQQGIVEGSDYKRFSVRAALNHQIGPKLTVSLSSTMSRIESDRQNSSGGSRGNSLIASILSAPPTLTPFNADGSYRIFILENPPSASRNPLNFIREQSDKILSNRVLANAALIYTPFPALSFRFSGGIENTDERNDQYTTRNFVSSQGSAFVNSFQSTSLLSENTVTYKLNSGRHGFTALAGITYQNFVNTFLSGSGNGFISDASGTYDLGAAITPGIPASGYARSAILSYLGRLNYDYDNKYLATISFRADGSSKYSEGNKWGYFPSGALAWRLSEERFLKNNKWISDLKLRAGWGLTGSQAIDAYATLNQLSSGKTVFDNTLYTTYAPGTRLPGDLKWETTSQLDIGLDLGLWNNRVQFTADYYVKNTRDLLNTVQLPSSLGFTTTIQNIGEVQNKGVEFGINARILTGDLRWDLAANLSINRNKVVKLYNGQDILGGFVAVTAVNDNANILREGQPIGRFWGYLENGYTADGKIQYQDLDKNGSISANDKTYIGDPNPDFIYGLNSTLAYRNFDLGIFIQGVQGNDLFNISSINNTIDYGNALNMPRAVFLNHWTPDNPNAQYPIISRATSGNVSNRWIEDGSFLRVKNIQLGYTFPLKGDRSGKLSSLYAFVSGQNLLTLTNYSWWDPEVNSSGGSNSTAQGFDYFTYPNARSFTIGIRAGF